MLAPLELSVHVAKRLAALAEAKGTTAEAVAVEALKEFTGSPASRRAIRVHRQGQSLADLGWLDGYKGQSVDDIFALADSEDAYLLLCALEEAIEEHGRKHRGSRTGTENIILAVMALLREVGNGGFDQFFRNSSKRWAFFAKDALLHIGRRDAAKIAGRAVRAVGVPASAAAMGPGIGEAFEILDRKMKAPGKKRDGTLGECDITFNSLTGLAESLLAYARWHPGGILRSR